MNDKKKHQERRQVAITHPEMLADAASMKVNFQELKDRNSGEQHMLTTLNIVDAASGMHIAPTIVNQVSSTLSKTFAHVTLRWACARKCLRVDPHRAHVSREIFDQSEGQEIFVDPAPAEAHRHMGNVEHHPRDDESMMGADVESNKQS